MRWPCRGDTGKLISPCSDGATCSRSFLRFDHEKRHHVKQQECGDQSIFERHRASGADSCTAANDAHGNDLLDHLVGGGEQAGWNFEAECLCGLKIDDELELGWLYHRQVSRLGTVEYFSGVNSHLAIRLREAR